VSTLAMTEYGMFESFGDVPSGRHAFNEDAVLTPIFHALARGGWRNRRHEPTPPATTDPADPVVAFQRDPLTAPIPVQALVAVPSQPWGSAADRPNPAAQAQRPQRGRHRLRTTR
jgi:hypothetical protein